MAPALPVFRDRQAQRPLPVSHREQGAPSTAEILVLHARDLEDGAEVIEAVRAGRCVILNTAGLVVEQARRLADFSQGGLCAMDGKMNRLSEDVYLFSPALSQIES